MWKKQDRELVLTLHSQVAARYACGGWSGSLNRSKVKLPGNCFQLARFIIGKILKRLRFIYELFWNAVYLFR